MKCTVVLDLWYLASARPSEEFLIFNSAESSDIIESAKSLLCESEERAQSFIAKALYILVNDKGRSVKQIHCIKRIILD